VGKLLPGSELFFIDEDGNPVDATGPDSFGIIACSNDSMMLGYWKAPELTEQALKDGRIIMTDVGYMDSDGYLYLMGRRDDVIVSGDHKIAPYEIENIVMQMPDIAECACIASPNSTLGAVPKLFVSMKRGAEFSHSVISKYISERLESHKMPRIIRVIDSFPRVGESTKIDRRKLTEYD
jgi:long-chain acyl-CoA synthetase